MAGDGELNFQASLGRSNKLCKRKKDGMIMSGAQEGGGQ
jgi:hypothetical protein